MGTSTFIEDTTTFSKIAYKPIFRISDTGVTTQMIGNIPYTSLDSIAAFAQSNTNGACYIFDTNAKAAAFQTMTNPTIPLVYSAADSNAPWNNVENNGNGNVVTRLCYMAPDNVDHSYIVTGQMRYQGRACYEVYSAFLEDYTFACSLRINVTKSGKEISKTDQTYKYIIDIHTILSTAGHTGYIECQVIAFSDMPGGAKTSEPVIMLSFGVVGLVEKTVVRRIQTTCDASSFKLTVTVIQISISIHFTTAVINVATRLIPTIRIGSDFHASVITGFPVILQYNIDNTGCTLRAISGRRVGNNFYLLDISGRHHIQNIRLVISR